MIDAESWTEMDTDVKSEIYEGLLEKNASDVKGGAGQYFTARHLIWAIVECVRPEPGKTFADLASGAVETIRKRLMQDADLHTILRHPTGIFYASFTKSNHFAFSSTEPPAARLKNSAPSFSKYSS